MCDHSPLFLLLLLVLTRSVLPIFFTYTENILLHLERVRQVISYLLLILYISIYLIIMQYKYCKCIFFNSNQIICLWLWNGIPFKYTKENKKHVHPHRVYSIWQVIVTVTLEYVNICVFLTPLLIDYLVYWLILFFVTEALKRHCGSK